MKKQTNGKKIMNFNWICKLFNMRIYNKKEVINTLVVYKKSHKIISIVVGSMKTWYIRFDQTYNLPSQGTNFKDKAKKAYLQ